MGPYRVSILRRVSILSPPAAPCCWGGHLLTSQAVGTSDCPRSAPAAGTLLAKLGTRGHILVPQVPQVPQISLPTLFYLCALCLAGSFFPPSWKFLVILRCQIKCLCLFEDLGILHSLTAWVKFCYFCVYRVCMLAHVCEGV